MKKNAAMLAILLPFVKIAFAACPSPLVALTAVQADKDDRSATADITIDGVSVPSLKSVPIKFSAKMESGYTLGTLCVIKSYADIISANPDKYEFSADAQGKFTIKPIISPVSPPASTEKPKS